MPKASSLKEYNIYEFIKEAIEKGGAKALVIGEEHFSTGDTDNILKILGALQKSYNVTFFAEYMPSNQPAGFIARKSDLDRFVERVDQIAISGSIERSRRDKMTVQYEGWKNNVMSQQINLDQALSSIDALALIMGMSIDKDSKPAFDKKAKKVVSVLKFAKEKGAQFFGIDLPTAPEAPGLGASARNWELFYQWDNARDPWMAEQIDNFLSDPTRATNDLLICFVGANHIKGLRSGTRNDVEVYSSAMTGKFTGIRNSAVAFLEFVATHSDFELYKADAKYFKYYSPE